MKGLDPMPYQTVTIATMDSCLFDRRSWPADSILDEWRAPDGWPLRRFRIGDGGRGALLFLGGRGDMIEKYLEPMAHWARRGWAVSSFDWRGQGGSGRLSADPRVGHCGDFGVWVHDLKAFFEELLTENKGPHVIVGHSMGGHLLLRAMIERSLLPDAVVLVAPMLGLNTGPFPAGMASAVASAMCRTADPARRAWKHSETPLQRAKMRHAMLTHCPDRYADELWWRRESPEISVGPPSWRWVAEAFRSTRMLERTDALASMDVPTLVLGATADRLVSTAAIQRIVARLPDASLHVYGREAAHEILREADVVRTDALARIDAFLEERAPSL